MTERKSVKKKIKIELDLEDESSSSEFDEIQLKKRKREHHKVVKYEDKFEESDESTKSRKKKRSREQSLSEKAQILHKSVKNIKIEPGSEDEISSSETDNNVQFKREQEQPEPDNLVTYESDLDDADEIMEILEKKKVQEQLEPEKAQILRELVIKLRHKVLPQHKIERACGTHVLSAEERKEFEELIYPKHTQKGAFTRKEDRIIINNWEAFCEMHNWDITNTKPFMYMRHNVGFYLAKWNERMKFVQFLADGLPYRTLYSVYHRFKNLYDNPKVRSKYSLQEDEYIIKYIEHNKYVDETRKFADIAKVLNRSRASVWRRYRLLKKKRNPGLN